MVTLYADGLCEPMNPGGYACWGWVAVAADGEEIAHDCGCLGHGPMMTNNLAEYRAVYEALEWAAEHDVEDAVVKTDSQLVARQVSGEWHCHAPLLIPLVEKVRRLLAQVNGRIEWVPREANGLADALSREAYARATGRDIQGWGQPLQPQGEDAMIIEQTKPAVLEPGWYQAVVADVQPVSGQYGDQLEFTFLLALPDGSQKRIRAWATPKFSPGTKLYAWCEAIFGRAIPPTYNLETEHLLKRAVDVRLERKAGPRGEFVKVAALAKAGSMTHDAGGDAPF